MAYEFEWDPEKAASNRDKHGVGFREATTVFGDVQGLGMPDPKHSVAEHRFVLLGRSVRDRLLVVCYTERPPRTRIISARLASRRERRQYETL
ncbi:MAG TPA: BrnT family toxin [Planctomycetota bacterium]|nr:BrnT family toxin [Planctomycetota bacterium]